MFHMSYVPASYSRKRLLLRKKEAWFSDYINITKFESEGPLWLQLQTESLLDHLHSQYEGLLKTEDYCTAFFCRCRFRMRAYSRHKQILSRDHNLLTSNFSIIDICNQNMVMLKLSFHCFNPTKISLLHLGSCNKE